MNRMECLKDKVSGSSLALGKRCQPQTQWQSERNNPWKAAEHVQSIPPKQI